MGFFDFFRKKTAALAFAATLTLSACAGGQHKENSAVAKQTVDLGEFNVMIFNPSMERSAPGRMQLDGTFGGDANLIARRLVMMVKQGQGLPAEIRVRVQVQSSDVTIEDKEFEVSLGVKEILDQSKLHTIKNLEAQVIRVFGVVSNLLKRQSYVVLHEAKITVVQAPEDVTGTYVERIAKLDQWKKRQLREAKSKQVAAFKFDKKSVEYKKKMAQAVSFLDSVNAEYNQKLKQLKRQFKK